MKQQRQRKPRPKHPRVPTPPPTEVMRDRRQRRPGTRAQQIQRELDEIENDIDAALEELADVDEQLRNQNG